MDAPFDEASAEFAESKEPYGEDPPRVFSATPSLNSSVLLGIDLLSWITAIGISAVLLANLRIHDVDVSYLAVVAVGAVTVQILAGSALGVYTGRWAVGSFEELYGLVVVGSLFTLGVIVAGALGAGTQSLTGGALASPLALGLIVSARLLVRLRSERLRHPAVSPTAKVLIFGGGEGGAQTVRAMLHTPTSPYLPVAILDDDPRKAHRRIGGVPVLGTRHDLARVVRETGAGMVIVAIPSADPALIRDIAERTRPLGVEFRLLPPLGDRFRDPVMVSDIRPLTYADLLGRDETVIDLDSAAGYLTGRRVLVTGAGGSIGSELCRQVQRFAPARLIMLDRDESALHAVQLSLEGHALLDSRDVVVADIRDGARLRAVFEEHQPDVVFHAAALKHLPLLQMYPSEAVKTNVAGTLGVLEAAVAVGTARVVNISTDKAADPTSVLGYSKRIAERVTSWVAATSDVMAMSVRFGNVLGSRGSVLHTFAEQIRAGGPVTVTDPKVTRYFMTVQEAVRLVIQAGAIGRSGEALVLDMGEPVCILDVAERLIRQENASVAVEFTGLRPGEKLEEVLLAEAEDDRRPTHPLIAQVPVPPVAPDRLADLDVDASDVVIIDRLRLLAASPPAGLPPLPGRPDHSGGRALTPAVTIRDPAPDGGAPNKG
jgi:FlaA1/EpsC-like NDP-sugar epimerase